MYYSYGVFAVDPSGRTMRLVDAATSRDKREAETMADKLANRRAARCGSAHLVVRLCREAGCQVAVAAAWDRRRNGAAEFCPEHRALVLALLREARRE